jgi:hypothetical protein
MHPIRACCQPRQQTSQRFHYSRHLCSWWTVCGLHSHPCLLERPQLPRNLPPHRQRFAPPARP